MDNLYVANQVEVKTTAIRKRRFVIKNCDSKIFSVILKCLNENKHSHMLKYTNCEKKEFQLTLTDKKSPKWTKDCVSLFQEMDKAVEGKKNRNIKHCDTECKNRAKANFCKLCNSKYLELLKKHKEKPYTYETYRILKGPPNLKEKLCVGNTKKDKRRNVRKLYPKAVKNASPISTYVNSTEENTVSLNETVTIERHGSQDQKQVLKNQHMNPINVGSAVIYNVNNVLNNESIYTLPPVANVEVESSTNATIIEADTDMKILVERQSNNATTIIKGDMNKNFLVHKDGQYRNGGFKKMTEFQKIENDTNEIVPDQGVHYPTGFLYTQQVAGFQITFEDSLFTQEEFSDDKPDYSDKLLTGMNPMFSTTMNFGINKEILPESKFDVLEKDTTWMNDFTFVNTFNQEK